MPLIKGFSFGLLMKAPNKGSFVQTSSLLSSSFSPRPAPKEVLHGCLSATGPLAKAPYQSSIWRLLIKDVYADSALIQAVCESSLL